MKQRLRRIFRAFCVVALAGLVQTSTYHLHAQTFTRVTNAGPISTDAFLSTGAAWNDFNNDGWLDMFALGEGENHFYINNGDSTFTELLTGDFLIPRGVGNGALWADFDNDGYQDVFIPNFVTVGGGTTLAPNVLFRNSGPPDFVFEEVSLGSELNASPSASWVDYDQDGDLDLFSAGASVFGGGDTSDLFYRQDTDSTFTFRPNLAIIEERPGVGTHDTWVDYDGDGDQDLYIVNWSSPNKLYKSMLVETGNPDHFELVGSSGLTNDAGILDIGSSWADYDNDGDMDVFLPVLNSSDRLYQNNGDGTFTQITSTPATSRRSVLGVWGDVDNDGDLDLYTGSQTPRFYFNDGQGGFVDAGSTDVGDLLVAAPSIQSGNWGDYNNDGNLDLYLLTYAIPSNRNGVPQPNYLLRNDGGTGNHWITVRCVGVLSNRSGVGAKVSVKSTIDGTDFWQTRIISGGTSSFVFHGDSRAHFGLGDATQADSIRILWPSGIEQVVTNQTGDQIVTITEDVPAQFIRANFFADVTSASGATSFEVQFTDQSLADPNNPVTSWEWDFDNDGTVDATTENPAHAFSSSSDTTFSVKLVVSNGTTSSTLVREGYITLDGVSTAIDGLGDGSSRVARLYPNYPNPFSNATTVSFEVTQPLVLRLTLHDLLGRQVRELSSGPVLPGRHDVEVIASELANGVYVVKLEAGTDVQSHTMSIVR